MSLPRLSGCWKDHAFELHSPGCEFLSSFFEKHLDAIYIISIRSRKKKRSQLLRTNSVRPAFDHLHNCSKVHPGLIGSQTQDECTRGGGFNQLIIWNSFSLEVSIDDSLLKQEKLALAEKVDLLYECFRVHLSCKVQKLSDCRHGQWLHVLHYPWRPSWRVRPYPCTSSFSIF